jgi:hypothetical protein
MLDQDPATLAAQIGSRPGERVRVTNKEPAAKRKARGVGDHLFPRIDGETRSRRPGACGAALETCAKCVATKVEAAVRQSVDAKALARALRKRAKAYGVGGADEFSAGIGEGLVQAAGFLERGAWASSASREVVGPAPRVAPATMSSRFGREPGTDAVRRATMAGASSAGDGGEGHSWCGVSACSSAPSAARLGATLAARCRCGRGGALKNAP